MWVHPTMSEHVSSVQTSLSSQLTGSPAAHRPAPSHCSFIVQALASSQVVPAAA
jgi:hypothetical protein